MYGIAPSQKDFLPRDRRQVTEPPEIMMLLQTKGKGYELRRRLGKKGLPQVLVGNQADLVDAYWKKKKIRKQRKWKPRKKAPSKTGNKKERILDFNIFQANVCGIDKKKVQIEKIFNERKVHIAVLQETLHSSCDIHITGYTPYPCKCQGCRGIITYIRSDIQAKVEILNWHPTDAHKVTLWYGSNKLTIYNTLCIFDVEFAF